MVKKRKQAGALLLSAVLLITQLSTTAMAENRLPEDGSIASFAALDGSVRNQTVPTGTELTELNLPETVTADIYHIMDGEDELILDEDEESIASPSEAGKRSESSTRSAEEISVTWDSSPVYDGDAEGKYLFTADVDSYTLSEGVKLPQITVTVTGGSVSHIKNISGWSFADDEFLNEGVLPLSRVSIDNQADFDTVVSMLPTKVKAEIDGEETASADYVSDSGLGGRGGDSGESHEVSLSVKSWNCPEYRQDEEGLWPFTGEYEFTAKLPDGYVCDPPPSVRVILGGAELYMINDLFTVDGLSYRELGPDTVKLVGYDGEKPTGSLSIPESVTRPSNGRKYRVVRIVSEAFRGCDGLTGDLIIPDTVTEIGARAFIGCKFTGSLTLSDSLVRIEDSAFDANPFTGELRLPDSLEYIGYAVFSGTRFTGKLTLPKQLNYIGMSAFYQCDFTGDLTIPDGVTYLGDSAFFKAGFTGGKLILPKGLNTIPIAAFYGCGFTDELVLPEGVTKIGLSAFERCGGFEGRLKLPDGMIKIDTDAFKDTRFEGFDTASQAVADLLLASGVDESKIQVGGSPYTPSPAPVPDPFDFEIDKMRYRIIKDNAVELVEYVGSNSAEDINIPAVVKYPNDDTGKTYSVTHIGTDAFYKKALTGTLNLPDSLTSIGVGAFSFNRFTGDLTIPDRVSNIELQAFGNSGFTGDLNIKGKLTEIGNNTFYSCGFTGTLSMADTVTTINESAFQDCSFTGIDLPARLRYIGKNAFSRCNRLTGTLIIPETVTEIGETAFAGCDGLTSAHLGSNLQKLGTQAFPKSLPLSTDSPRVQLLINTYLEQDAIADTSWNGKEDVPDGAIAAIKTDAAVAGDKRIGTEAVITVPDGKTLTVDGRLVVDGSLIVNGTLLVNGTLVIRGSLSGSGTLIIGRYGKVEGDTSGIFVVYYRSSDGSGGSAVNPNILLGSWERTETGIWKFRQTNGTYAVSRWGLVDNLWYYFNADGHMLTGWQFINGQWYYLCTDETAKVRNGMKEGAMASGWYYDVFYQNWFYFDENGAMVTGWREIDGTRYYFNPVSDGQRGILTETSGEQPKK